MEFSNKIKRRGAIILIVLFAFLFTTGCMDKSSIVVTEPLISLDRSDTVEGHFYLGSGNIEGKPSYSYYVQTSNGGLKLKSVSSDICTVYRDQDITPYITAGYAPPPMFGGTGYNYANDMGDIGDRYIMRKYGNSNSYTEYKLDSEVEIHIPRNSTIGGYNP